MRVQKSGGGVLFLGKVSGSGGAWWPTTNVIAARPGLTPVAICGLWLGFNSATRLRTQAMTRNPIAMASP